MQTVYVCNGKSVLPKENKLFPFNVFFKDINNLSILNKEDHKRDGGLETRT